MGLRSPGNEEDISSYSGAWRSLGSEVKNAKNEGFAWWAVVARPKNPDIEVFDRRLPFAAQSGSKGALVNGLGFFNCQRCRDETREKEEAQFRARMGEEEMRLWSDGAQCGSWRSDGPTTVQLTRPSTLPPRFRSLDLDCYRIPAFCVCDIVEIRITTVRCLCTSNGLSLADEVVDLGYSESGQLRCLRTVN
ncbi:MAG: hypothetical protein M1840_007877 [Geoglossum simile]|nr:MAG: hypothetical protein M1840_007877 [Geoglossum simile]